MSQMSKYKKGCLGHVGIFVLFVIIMAMMALSEDNEGAYSIGMTPQQFQANFNSTGKENSSNLLISKFENSIGDKQDIASYSFSNYIGITCAVNKKGGGIRFATLLYKEPNISGMMSDSMEKRVNYNVESSQISTIITQFIYTVSPELNDKYKPSFSLGKTDFPREYPGKHVIPSLMGIFHVS